MREFWVCAVHKLIHHNGSIRGCNRYIDIGTDKKRILICRTSQIGALFSSLLSIQISIFGGKMPRNSFPLGV